MTQKITIDQLFRAICENEVEFSKSLGPGYYAFVLPVLRDIALNTTESLFNKALTYTEDGQ